MNKISCDLCMDLMPLVHDGVASQESCAAVTRHIQECSGCKALFEGELRTVNRSSGILRRLQRKGVLLAVISLLAVLCAIFTAVMITKQLDARRDEQRYMTNLFGDLREISWTAERVAMAESGAEVMDERVLWLRFQLDAVDETLMDGHLYVSDAIQSVAGWWFMESSAKLQKSLSESGAVTAETVRLAGELHEDLEYMLEQMEGPDQLNIDPELTIEEFSEIIFSFYRNQ